MTNQTTIDTKSSYFYRDTYDSFEEKSRRMKICTGQGQSSQPVTHPDELLGHRYLARTKQKVLNNF